MAGEGNAGTFIPVHNAFVQQVADLRLFSGGIQAGSCPAAVKELKKPGLDAGDRKSFRPVEEDVGLSVGAAWIAGQDRSMWRTLRPSAGQAQQ